MNELVNTLLALLIGLTLVIVLVITFTFCAADARRRGKSPLLLFLAVVLFFPWGLIAWLLFRPELLDPTRRSFRLQDHRVQ